MLDAAELSALLGRHAVAGVSVAAIQPTDDGSSKVVAQVAGLASREPRVPMYDSTWMEIASLSKTLAAAFAIEYFTSRGIGMDSFVNPLLREAGGSFQLTSAAGYPPEWAEAVTLAQLVNHTGLGMHYVNGVPLTEKMPAVVDLISGTADAPAPYGYASVELTKQPGTAFGCEQTHSSCAMNAPALHFYTPSICTHCGALNLTALCRPSIQILAGGSWCCNTCSRRERRCR